MMRLFVARTLIAALSTSPFEAKGQTAKPQNSLERGELDQTSIMPTSPSLETKQALLPKLPLFDALEKTKNCQGQQAFTSTPFLLPSRHSGENYQSSYGKTETPKNPKVILRKPADPTSLMKIKEFIKQAVAPKEVTQLKELKPGHSGARVFEVSMRDYPPYFAKVIFDWKDVEKPSEFFAELDKTQEASQAGLTPKVIYADKSQGLLITEFIENEMSDWHDGAKEPRFSATLKLLQTLHHSETGQSLTSPKTERMETSFSKNLQAVADKDANDPTLQLVSRVAKESHRRLAALAYLPARTHGDFHQANVLFGKGKAWLIDCGTLSFGDPMKELAYYFYHVSIGVKESTQATQSYGVLSSEEKVRLGAHLSLMHAQRYLETLKGMPWDAPEHREGKLKQHAEWLAEDLAIFTSGVD